MAGACVRFRFASDRPAAGLIYFARQSACSTPALTDLIAGSIDAMFDPMPSSIHRVELGARTAAHLGDHIGDLRKLDVPVLIDLWTEHVCRNIN